MELNTIIMINPKIVKRKSDGTPWAFAGSPQNQLVRRVEPDRHYWRRVKRSFFNGRIIFAGIRYYESIDLFEIPEKEE